MFSQAGSASDGVAWISSLLTAFLRVAFPLITTNGRFHEKGQKDTYADARLL